MLLELKTVLRGLHRSPVFTLTAVLVLGLGLGANTVLFNVVHALLWRPLPFPNSGRLVSLRQRSPIGDISLVMSGQTVADVRTHVQGIADIGLTEDGADALAIARAYDVVALESAGVNSAYFRALGLRPVVGRLFGEEEDLGQVKEQRVVLTESAWRTYFGADPSIAGRVLQCVEGDQHKPLRILGVVSDRETLPFVSSANVLTPIPWLAPEIQRDRANQRYRTVIRLKPGVALEDVSNQVANALRLSEQEVPGHRGLSTSWIEPLRTVLVSSFRTPVWLLYAAAGLLLLLTVTNVASLFLARAMARAHETALRGALGATLAHTLRSFFLEALLVCAAGLVVALTLNAWAQSLVPRFVPEIAAVGPSLLDPGPQLVAFASLVCLLVAASLSALPTIHARRASLVASVAQAGRVVTAPGAWRTVLVEAQLAIILVLLAVSSLVGRSFTQALATDPGFAPGHVVTFTATLPVAAQARTSAAYDLARAIRSVPGTVRVAFSSEAPIGSFYTATHRAGVEPLTAQDPMVAFRLVGSDYFRTLGVRFVEGHAFSEEDVEARHNVTVLNQAAARLLFGRADPLGRIVHSGLGGRKLTVVGVIRDIRSDGLDLPAPAMVYIPYIPFGSYEIVYSARTSGDVVAWQAAMRARVKAWNANALVRDVSPLDDDVRKTVQGRFRAAALIGLFAGLGLLVASVGLYATMAGSVQRRAREIGVRIALGATTRNVLGEVLAQGARVLACGAGVGLAGAVVTARVIRGELYGIGPLDVVSFALALGLLCAAALAATLLPALRATHIDPAQALRRE